MLKTILVSSVLLVTNYGSFSRSSDRQREETAAEVNQTTDSPQEVMQRVSSQSGDLLPAVRTRTGTSEGHQVERLSEMKRDDGR